MKFFLKTIFFKKPNMYYLIFLSHFVDCKLVTGIEMTLPNTFPSTRSGNIVGLWTSNLFAPTERKFSNRSWLTLNSSLGKYTS